MPEGFFLSSDHGNIGNIEWENLEYLLWIFNFFTLSCSTFLHSEIIYQSNWKCGFWFFYMKTRVPLRIFSVSNMYVNISRQNCSVEISSLLFPVWFFLPNNAKYDNFEFYKKKFFF